MKRIINIALVSSFVFMTTITTSSIANADDITESSWFEPAVGCIGGGLGGYAVSTPGNELTDTAIGCAAGALIGWLLNQHYQSKYGKVYQADIAELRRGIKEMELQQAMKSANGEDENYSIKIRKVVPGQKLQNGSVTAPTIVETIVPPGETVRLGD